jgi:NADPH-dependent 7-cyano-7-deazaguanine reductase QueF-like protein
MLCHGTRYKFTDVSEESVASQYSGYDITLLQNVEKFLITQHHIPKDANSQVMKTITANCQNIKTSYELVWNMYGKPNYKCAHVNITDVTY